MRLDKFGDTYDVVKQSLLRWLSPCGGWAAHPMFTEQVSEADARAFQSLLGVPLLCAKPLTRGTDRNEYFAGAAGCDEHLFLDPNTGLRVPEALGSDRVDFLGGVELVRIAASRRNRLTLVFDQSIDRRYPVREQVEQKLSWLQDSGVYGVAYQSHACFVLVCASEAILREAVGVLERESRLPTKCLVRGPWGRRTSG